MTHPELKVGMKLRSLILGIGIVPPEDPVGTAYTIKEVNERGIAYLFHKKENRGGADYGEYTWCVLPKEITDGYYEIVDEFEPYAMRPHFSYGVNCPSRTTTKKSPTLMNKLSNLYTRLVDKDVKTLVEAGYLNRDLSLTLEGCSTLEEIMFLEHKDELVKSAKEKLADEKK